MSSPKTGIAATKKKLLVELVYDERKQENGSANLSKIFLANCVAE